MLKPCSDISKVTEDRIPIVEESLHVSKIDSVEEVTIIKEPITETKIVEMNLTHEEIIVRKKTTKPNSS